MMTMQTKTLAEIKALHPVPAYILECPENDYVRVLVWANEAESENDDGAHAVASYRLSEPLSFSSAADGLVG